MTRRLFHRNLSTRRCQATLLALWVGAAVSGGAAQAGVISTSLGNVPMGQPSSWHSEVRMRTPYGEQSWSLDGATSTSRTLVAPGQDYGQNTVTIDHVVGTNLAGTVSLSSSASVRGNLPWGSMFVQARGASVAYINDTVTVRDVNHRPLSGFISFGWRTDGTLQQEFRSMSGVDFGHNTLYYAGFSWAEVFVKWTDPYTRANTDSVAQTFGSSTIPFLAHPSDVQRAAYDPWPGPGGTLVSAESFAIHSEYQQTEVVDKAGVFGTQMAMAEGISVPIMLGLLTSYNTTWDLLDVGDLELGVYSDFSHTAVLAGVNFFNPDGSPYIGEWQLVSANGYDYPEVVLQASSSVDAPAPLGLAAAGLLGLAWRGRRRQAGAQLSK